MSNEQKNKHTFVDENVQVDVINLDRIDNIGSGKEVEGIEKINIMTIEEIEGTENEEPNEILFGSNEEGSYFSPSDDGNANHSSRKKSRRVHFDESSRVPHFQVGMVFRNKQQFIIVVDRQVVKT